MVEGVFRLDELAAEDLMTPRGRIVWLNIDESNEMNWRKIVASGGKVILFHVAKPSEFVSPVHAPSGTTALFVQARHEAGIIQCRERLLRNVPPDASGRNISFEVEIVEGAKVGDAILDAATRFDVDLICLGRHGHSRLATALLGSTSDHVLNKSVIPVLLCP